MRRIMGSAADRAASAIVRRTASSYRIGSAMVGIDGAGARAGY